MYTHHIVRTCSMKEISGVNGHTNLNISKEELKIELGITEYTNVKAFLLNTNSNTIRLNTNLKRLGFKKVFNYKGNGGTVYTWMLKVSDLNKKETKK